MNYTTLDALDFATDWFATCPKCSTRYGPDQITCFNCGGRILFFREMHSCQRQRQRGANSEKVKWTECGFVCAECGVKYKHFTCNNHDDVDVVIAVPRVWAYLRSPWAKWLKLGAGLLAFFLSLGGTGNLLQATSMSEDAALVLSYVVAIVVTRAAVKAVKANKLSSYDQ